MNTPLRSAFLFVILAMPALGRVWTSAADPEKQFEGDLVDCKDGKIMVKLGNGKLIGLAADSVSKEDREYAEKQMAMAPSERDITKSAAAEPAKEPDDKTKKESADPDKKADAPIADKPKEPSTDAPDDATTPPDKSAGVVAGELFKNLVKLEGKDLKPFGFSKGKEPKFYLVCFAAKWSKPSMERLPKLVDYYNKTVKPLGNVEMILYSFDNTEAEQKALLTGAELPFPAVTFQAVEKKSVKSLGKLAGEQVPQFVLVDADGKKLYDQYEEPDAATLKKLAQSREL